MSSLDQSEYEVLTAHLEGICKDIKLNVKYSDYPDVMVMVWRDSARTYLYTNLDEIRALVCGITVGAVSAAQATKQAILEDANEMYGKCEY